MLSLRVGIRILYALLATWRRQALRINSLRTVVRPSRVLDSDLDVYAWLGSLNSKGMDAEGQPGTRERNIRCRKRTVVADASPPLTNGFSCAAAGKWIGQEPARRRRERVGWHDEGGNRPKTTPPSQPPTFCRRLHAIGDTHRLRDSRACSLPRHGLRRFGGSGAESSECHQQETTAPNFSKAKIVNILRLSGLQEPQPSG